ncbi:LPXTG cell wall anchor domain-containing protein [Enterococcus mundtii]|nr:LPXTG cell wall anchor domain-containing protein [Enterococcus mundtii]
MNKVAISKVNQQSIPTWVYVVVGVLLGIILLLIIYFLFIRKKKKKSNQKGL